MTRLDTTDRTVAIMLAALAGYIDAAGFLASDGFFVSFMSGNTTRLGVSLADLTASAGIAARLILLFVGGVAIGTLGARRAGRARRPVMLSVIAMLVAIAAALGARAYSAQAVAVLAVTMGMQNTVIEGDGEVRVGITYMTGTLVRVGQHLANAIEGGPHLGWLPHFALWASLMSGAWTGALLFMRFGFASLWFAAIVAAILALFALIAVVRSGEASR